MIIFSLTGVVQYFVYSVYIFHTKSDIDMVDEELTEKLTDPYLENRSSSYNGENKDDDINTTFLQL